MSRENPKSPRGAVERSFAAQLEDAMKLQRFTPDSLSSAAGISAASVRNYLLGQFLPRHSILAALEDALGVRFDLHDPSATKAAHLPAPAGESPDPAAPPTAPVRLSITEAKLALARTFGVSPNDIQIIVRS